MGNPIFIMLIPLALAGCQKMGGLACSDMAGRGCRGDDRKLAGKGH